MATFTLLAVIALLGGGAQKAQESGVPPGRTAPSAFTGQVIGDWTATCDAARTCSISAGAPDGHWISVSRTRNGEPVILAGFPELPSAAPPSLSGPDEAWLAIDDSVNEMMPVRPGVFTLPGGPGSVIFCEIRLGSEIQLSRMDEVQKIPIDMAAVAMAWLDEQSGN